MGKLTLVLPVHPTPIPTQMTPHATQMFRSNPDHTRRSRFPVAGTQVIAAALAAFLYQTGPAASQSAGNFGAKPIPEASSPQSAKKPLSPDSKDTTPSAILPSRFVGEAEFDAYIQSLSTQLSMKRRETDPFGQYQDPNARPAPKATVAKTGNRVVQQQATPFPEIIKKISVNAIMPREKKFLIGAKTYIQGGTLSIIHRGKSIHARILAVGSRQIEFSNPETGETATLKIETLPVGMTQGTHGITAPGMSSDLQDAPINLDSGTP